MFGEPTLLVADLGAKSVNGRDTLARRLQALSRLIEFTSMARQPKACDV
jgi:hypothetical protein